MQEVWKRFARETELPLRDADRFDMAKFMGTIA